MTDLYQLVNSWFLVSSYCIFFLTRKVCWILIVTLYFRTLTVQKLAMLFHFSRVDITVIQASLHLIFCVDQLFISCGVNIGHTVVVYHYVICFFLLTCDVVYMLIFLESMLRCLCTYHWPKRYALLIARQTGSLCSYHIVVASSWYVVVASTRVSI